MDFHRLPLLKFVESIFTPRSSSRKQSGRREENVQKIQNSKIENNSTRNRNLSQILHNLGPRKRMNSLSNNKTSLRQNKKVSLNNIKQTQKMYSKKCDFSNKNFVKTSTNHVENNKREKETKFIAQKHPCTSSLNKSLVYSCKIDSKNQFFRKLTNGFPRSKKSAECQKSYSLNRHPPAVSGKAKRAKCASEYTCHRVLDFPSRNETKLCSKRSEQLCQNSCIRTIENKHIDQVLDIKTGVGRNKLEAKNNNCTYDVVLTSYKPTAETIFCGNASSLINKRTKVVQKAECTPCKNENSMVPSVATAFSCNQKNAMVSDCKRYSTSPKININDNDTTLTCEGFKLKHANKQKCKKPSFVNFSSKMFYRLRRMSPFFTKDTSTGKKVIKGILFCIVVIAWSPCIIAVAFLWCLSYPCKPKHSSTPKNRMQCKDNQSKTAESSFNSLRPSFAFWRKLYSKSTLNSNSKRTAKFSENSNKPQSSSKSPNPSQPQAYLQRNDTLYPNISRCAEKPVSECKPNHCSRQVFSRNFCCNRCQVIPCANKNVNHYTIWSPCDCTVNELGFKSSDKQYGTERVRQEVRQKKSCRCKKCSANICAGRRPKNWCKKCSAKMSSKALGKINFSSMDIKKNGKFKQTGRSLSESKCPETVIVQLQGPEDILKIIECPAITKPTFYNSGDHTGTADAKQHKVSKVKHAKQKLSKEKVGKQNVAKENVSKQKVAKQNVAKKNVAIQQTTRKLNSPKVKGQVKPLNKVKQVTVAEGHKIPNKKRSAPKRAGRSKKKHAKNKKLKEKESSKPTCPRRCNCKTKKQKKGKKKYNNYLRDLRRLQKALASPKGRRISNVKKICQKKKTFSQKIAYNCKLMGQHLRNFPGQWIIDIFGSYKAIILEKHAYPVRVDCDSLFIHARRYKPCVWLYKLCPKLYLRVVRWRQCLVNTSNSVLVIVAFCMWCPAIIFCVICISMVRACICD